MYADLREGIVELFEAAQRLGAPRRARMALLSEEEHRAFRSAQARILKPKTRKVKVRWRRRIDSELRAQRVSYTIVPIAAETRLCPSCGSVEELRPGLNRWQHMTRGGACVVATRA